MSDLDAAIRARVGALGDWGEIAARLAGALLAVLDLHADVESHLCPAETVGYSVQRWHDADDPCPTVRAIAEKLGVEADRG